MNILLCSWANIFEPEIIYCFDKMEFHLDKFDALISNPFSDGNYLKLLSNHLLSNKYDFIFSVNYIPIVSMASNIHKIKYISWVADSPCFELNSHTISSPYNYIFIFDKLLYEYYHNDSPNNIYHLPLGSNVTRLDNIILSDDENAKHQSDISFVGSLYTSRSKYNKVILSDYWHGYFEGIIESQLLVYGYNLINDTISPEAINAFSKAIAWDDDKSIIESNKLYKTNVQNLISDFIGKECSHRERIRIIEKLSENFKFDLYTNEDTSDFPLVNNKGIVEPTNEVFKIYKSSKINLNITSKTIKSGLPLRIFDIMGAGGFLITNYQTEIPEYFEINKDLVLYESIDDLVDKTSYYLSHEDERLEIAHNGYMKVKNLYQFKKRIVTMLEVVFNN